MAENNQSVSAPLLHDPESRQAELHAHPLTVHTDAIVRTATKSQPPYWKQFKSRTLNDEDRSWRPPMRKNGPSTSEDGLMAASNALIQGDYMTAGKINATVVQPAYQNAKAAADDLREYYAKTGRGFTRGRRTSSGRRG